MAWSGNADAGSPTISTSYLSTEEADSLAASRPNSAAWTGTAKEAALQEATRRIDALPLRGCRYDYLQALEFPRIIDDVIVGDTNQNAVVPDPVLWACLEEAIAILAAGSGSLKDLQEQGVSQMSIGGKLSYTFVQGAGNSGLISSAAKRYLRRYLGAEVR